MSVPDLLHLAFGSAAGLALVALLLLARQNIGSRGLPRSLASLAGALLAMILLLAAAAQLEPVLLSLKIDPVTREMSFKMPNSNGLLSNFLAFLSWTAFPAAMVGGVAAGLLAWVTTDDPAEESGEPYPLADGAGEQIVLE